MQPLRAESPPGAEHPALPVTVGDMRHLCVGMMVRLGPDAAPEVTACVGDALAAIVLGQGGAIAGRLAGLRRAATDRHLRVLGGGRP